MIGAVDGARLPAGLVAFIGLDQAAFLDSGDASQYVVVDSRDLSEDVRLLDSLRPRSQIFNELDHQSLRLFPTRNGNALRP